MKTYVVKIISVNLNRGEASTCYIGKDGYVWHAVSYPVGWKKRYYAEQYIKKSLIDYDEKQLTDCIGLTKNKWLYHYEIIEREED